MIDARYPKRSRLKRFADNVKKHQRTIYSAAVGSIAAYYTANAVMDARDRKLRQDMGRGDFMIPLEKPNRYVRIPVMFDPDNENL